MAKKKVVKVLDLPKVDPDLCPVILESDVELLAIEQLSTEEIAAKLGCSNEYIRDHFSQLIHKHQHVGRGMLRSQLYKMSMKGNLGACIWLSKQYLGMKDRHDDAIQIVNFNVQVNEVPGE